MPIQALEAQDLVVTLMQGENWALEHQPATALTIPSNPREN